MDSGSCCCWTPAGVGVALMNSGESRCRYYAMLVLVRIEWTQEGVALRTMDSGWFCFWYNGLGLVWALV